MHAIYVSNLVQMNLIILLCRAHVRKMKQDMHIWNDKCSINTDDMITSWAFTCSLNLNRNEERALVKDAFAKFSKCS